MFANKNYLLLVTICFFSLQSFSQKKAYFIDGYHGGVWGHYPKGYTRYVVDQLKMHPDWKINLEIEPETWDHEKVDAPEAYEEFKKLFDDQSSNGRIEYVSAAFGQPYLYNISGESIIRNFEYGMRKVREHFPNTTFTTYSSEEPCFTSALPQILTSFGYKYASLKNPNTLWGGYTRNFGGELVNWIGPDGTKLTTVPRYEVELLKPGSTWETIGNANSHEYINAALDYGIQNPIGMCLQDAGWRVGPWLKGGFYKPTEYVTWRNYFDNIVNKTAVRDWDFSQEDIMPGLVWGAQVLQTISQQVRYSENKIIQAEKLASMAQIFNGLPYPLKQIDKAWRPLMLSQHHDCWIVPYNGKKGDTWADKVVLWTDTTDNLSDDVIAKSVGSFSKSAASTANGVRVFNTTGSLRSEWVALPLPQGWVASQTIIT
ncbi:MAG: glycosyl hydrolase, partial [Chitinophagaceae bacterium]